MNTPTLSTDTALSLVADPQRRAVIDCLRQHRNNAVTVDELVDKLTSRPQFARQQPDTESLEIRLRHCHLPKLDEADVVEYDTGNGTVRYHRTPKLTKLVEYVSEEFE
jgi:hypothetical protein